MKPEIDPATDLGRPLSFSEAQGYVDVPKPLALEQLPETARTLLWSVLYNHLDDAATGPQPYRSISGGWRTIMHEVHYVHFSRPADEWSPRLDYIARLYKKRLLEQWTFREVFDFLLFIMHRTNPDGGFVQSIKQAFTLERVAYLIVDDGEVAIVPAATAPEREALARSMEEIHQAGLKGAESHIKESSSCINDGRWAASVRESIHAVESVARQICPNAKSLAAALKSLDAGTLHPALRGAFEKLYGYTSDEQGVRHALLDQDDANVGQDEAVFMLGACASFASFLWRKHLVGKSA
ncbi:MAG: hypothetical protein F4Y86_04260 [Gammaproteobacteria bacterium]|nr:hypothetical protein [Gammaproteobacteria bacterium]